MTEEEGGKRKTTKRFDHRVQGQIIKQYLEYPDEAPEPEERKTVVRR